jgi:hypothetical protein
MELINLFVIVSEGLKQTDHIIPKGESMIKILKMQRLYVLIVMQKPISMMIITLEEENIHQKN